MAKRVITTVGTSLFTNYMKRDDVIRAYSDLSNDYETIDTQFKNLNERVDPYDAKKKVNIPASERTNSKHESDIEYIKERIEFLWLEKAKEKASAEIETLYKIAEDEQQGLEVYLLATDTVLSVLACELIKEWFDKTPSVKNTNIKIKCHFHGDINAPDTTIIEGLQVKDADAFNTIGFQKLLKILKKWSDKETIFNITGGYKAIIPFMTLYAQLKNIELRYMYEESDNLVKVGNLPIQFDWAVGELYHDFLCEEEIRLKLDESNPVYTSLIDYELIYPNKQLTALGLLFKDYIDAKMPEAKGTFGYFAEYKVYEFLIENPYSDFVKPKKSIDYYWNKQDKTQCIQTDDTTIKRDAANWEPIELDLVLKNAQNEQIWSEIKPFTNSGLKSVKAQIKTRLQFVEQIKTLDAQPIDFRLKEIFLIVYKFDFQDINSHSKNIKEIKQLFEGKAIGFKMFYFNVPVDLNKDKINYKAFFDKPIELINHIV